MQATCYTSVTCSLFIVLCSGCRCVFTSTIYSLHGGWIKERHVQCCLLKHLPQKQMEEALTGSAWQRSISCPQRVKFGIDFPESIFPQWELSEAVNHVLKYNGQNNTSTRKARKSLPPLWTLFPLTLFQNSSHSRKIISATLVIGFSSTAV